MTGHYRADQVGSLLRPPELLRARAAKSEGRLETAELRKIEDQAILGALELQRQVGVDVFTDGEFRRAGWMTEMAEAVEGFVPDRLPIEWRGPGGGIEGSLAHVVGARLRQTRRLTAHELAFLKAHTQGPVKMTMPSPSVFMLTSFKPGLTDRFYTTRADLLHDLARIVQHELKALADEGVPYVQLDAPQYGRYIDQRIREHLRQDGVDAGRALDDAIAADNACLEGVKREGMTLAMHISRATAGAAGSRRAATIPLPRSSLAPFASTGSSWSTTASAREASSRCASCPGGRP